MKIRTHSQREYNYILNYAKRWRVHQMFGGKCQKCNDDVFWHLCLHHTNPEEKKFAPSVLLANEPWSIIETEILKCELLCYNCHRETHKFETLSRMQLKKKHILEQIHKFECEECGYNKCYNALDFHHKYKDKKINIARLCGKNTTTQGNLVMLIEEMGKCNLLCANCHSNKHFDDKKFNEYKDIIISKSITHIEKPKIDVATVKKLYEEYHSYKKVIELTGCSKATVFYYCNKSDSSTS